MAASNRMNSHIRRAQLLVRRLSPAGTRTFKIGPPRLLVSAMRLLLLRSLDPL